MTASESTVESSAIQRIADPIYRSKGWMKFLGVLSVLNGVVQALTCIGILWAWLPIWQGVLLFQAAGGIEDASASGNEARLIYSLDRIRLYFLIMGIVTLIAIVMSIASVFLVLTFLLGAAGVAGAAAS